MTWTWDEAADIFASVQYSRFDDEHAKAVRAALIQNLAARFLHSDTAEIEQIASALRDEQRKWLVASVAKEAVSIAPLPEQLFAPFVRAGVYETCPSSNRTFIEIALLSFGPRRVNEALLDYLENGTDFEKAGAANALYWADKDKKPRNNPHSDIAAEWEDLSDLWQRRHNLRLQEFVRNENVDVRRSLIPSLKLNEAHYPLELRFLVSQAIRIAQAHPDTYIRSRLKVQLGESSLYSALPHRQTPDEPRA